MKSIHQEAISIFLARGSSIPAPCTRPATSPIIVVIIARGLIREKEKENGRQTDLYRFRADIGPRVQP